MFVESTMWARAPAPQRRLTDAKMDLMCSIMMSSSEGSRDEVGVLVVM